MRAIFSALFLSWMALGFTGNRGIDVASQTRIADQAHPKWMVGTYVLGIQTPDVLILYGDGTCRFYNESCTGNGPESKGSWRFGGSSVLLHLEEPARFETRVIPTLSNGDFYLVSGDSMHRFAKSGPDQFEDYVKTPVVNGFGS
jgi:hypothetical protein